MSKILIVAPRISEGARDLRESLIAQGVQALYRRKDNSYRNIQMDAGQDLIVNWGCGNHPTLPSVSAGTAVTRLNDSTNVATNKLEAFQAMAQARVPIPEFTEDRARARRWVAEGHRVYCRTALRGHSGEDIVMADSANPVVAAPLYTKEVVKHHEFRFHVFCGQVIDGVRKGFRSDIPEDQRDHTIMNHAAGTTFFRSGQALERASQNVQLLQDCVRAVGALGLDFGAVDVMTDREGNHYILEVNTAPGLEASTLTRYTDAIKEKFNNQPITPWNFANATGSNNQTRENTMPALSVTVNTTDITTLTNGQSYQVVADRRDIDNTIQLRNDRNRLQRYTVRNHFTFSTAAAVPSAPSAPAAQPLLPEAPTIGNAVRTDVPSESPERVIRLEDGSQVNVTGSAVFTESGSLRLTQGQRYTIACIRLGSNTGRTFIGVMIDGTIQRYRSSSFSQGQRTPLLTNATTAAPTPPPAPTVLEDSEGNQVQVGGSVRVTTRTGGHGFRVGAILSVTGVNVEGRTLQAREGSNNVRTISISRVQALTSEQVTLLQQEQREREGTTELLLGTQRYRIRSIDLPRAQAAIRQFTI